MFILTTCTSGKESQNAEMYFTPTAALGETRPKTDHRTIEIENVNWRLVSYVDQKGNLMSILPDTQILIMFDGEQVSGSSGCNSYFAEYDIKDDFLVFRNAGLTERYCTTPSGIMEQESSYLSSLQSVNTFRIVGDQLQMIDFQGNTVLTYVVDTIIGDL